KSGPLSVLGSLMEQDVLGPGQARRARWPAVDARRFDRIIKGSVCCFFTFNHCQPATVIPCCVRKLLDFNCLIHRKFLSHFRQLQPIEIPRRHLSVFCFQIQSLERSSHEFGYESKMRSVVCKPSRYVSRGSGANHISLCQTKYQEEIIM